MFPSIPFGSQSSNFRRIPWMLEAAIVVSAALREYPEAAVVALLVVFNAALSLFQQSRAQTTLDALKTRLALNAQVKRDGAWITAPAANLVADAIVKLTLGAVVPAEVRVLTGSVLVDALATEGFRIIAVAAGPTGDLTLQGLIGLSDPPRDDAAGLVAELATLGVRMVMITGDAPATAGFVAHAVGIGSAMSTTSSLTPNVNAKTFAIFAGVLPEDKFAIVKALQDDGDIVGMCGDGANDAPALRQAQMGIAVSTATDIAKSVAGMVLTLPGLSGVVTAKIR
jgi:magnesium-transporting ATPase (P-type)